MGAIVVTGVPGVGKTTVMEAAAQAAKRKVVVYGTEMFQVAKGEGLVEDRDEMRRLAPSEQKRIQVAAAASIAAQGDVIVDTHSSIRTPQGFLPGLPAWVLETLSPDAIVLVEADPEEIAGRRSKDATRVRDADTPQAIALHQQLNRAFAAAYATLTGAVVAIVENHDGRVEEAVEQVLPVVQA
jgi:adenylate kinase